MKTRRTTCRKCTHASTAYGKKNTSQHRHICKLTGQYVCPVDHNWFSDRHWKTACDKYVSTTSTVESEAE